MGMIFNAFHSFVEALAEKKHDLGADVLKVALTNTAPVASNTVLANITQIANGNGYVTGGNAAAAVTSAQTDGTYKLVRGDVAFTCDRARSGRSVMRCCTTTRAVNDELIGWWDYGSSISLGNGDTFTVDLDATNGVLTLAQAPTVTPPFHAHAVDFTEATPDYLTRATDFAGNADAYTGTFSCWFRRDGQDTADTFVGSEGNTVRIRFQAANTLNFSFIGPGAETFQFTSTGTYLTSATWRWIGASWNLNAAAGAKVIHIYDDAGIIAGTPIDASAAFMVDYTRVGHGIATAMPGWHLAVQWRPVKPVFRAGAVSSISR